MPITYCIVCNITNEKYYGSSKNTLEVRMSFHKSKSNKCCSKKIILRGDYDSYILGEYETIEEAEMKEDWYIDNKECINERRVKVTNEERLQKCNEYYYNNRKVKKQYQKIYYQENKEQIREYKKEFYEQNKEQINEKRNEKNREKVECEFCKTQLNRSSLTNHIKSFHFN